MFQRYLTACKMKLKPLITASYPSDPAPLLTPPLHAPSFGQVLPDPLFFLWTSTGMASLPVSEMHSPLFQGQAIFCSSNLGLEVTFPGKHFLISPGFSKVLSEDILVIDYQTL